MRKNKILATVMLSSLMVSIFPTKVHAFETGGQENEIQLTSKSVKNIEELDAYDIDTELVEKLLSVSYHIKFGKDQKSLICDLSDEELLNNYGFSYVQLKDFKEILAGSYHFAKTGSPIIHDAISTRAAARYYISNNDLKAGTFAVLAAAAQAGPAALMAAWTSISTALAGPLGTIAGLGTAVLGATFFADLAVKITGALVQGKGIAFYLDWGIPPVKTAIE